MLDYHIYEDRAEDAKAKALDIVRIARSENRPLSEGEETTYKDLSAQMETWNTVAKEAREAEISDLKAQASERISHVTNEPVDVNALFRNMKINQSQELWNAFPTSGCTSGACYLVGQEWHDTVEKLRYENNFMRANGARVIRTAGTHNIPILSSLGDIGWTGELAAYTACDPVLAPIILYAYKATRKQAVSEELLEDAMYDVAAYLAEATGMAFARGEENKYMVGCGTACIQPAGIFACSTACFQGACVACTFPCEIITMSYKLDRQYRDGAGWMMNPATVLKIALLGVPMKDQSATCTTNAALPYFWTDAIGGEPARLMGFPIWTNSCIAVMATCVPTMALGNPKFYVIGERGPMKVKRLQLDEYSDTFAFSQRIDGKMMTTDAFKVFYNG